MAPYTVYQPRNKITYAKDGDWVRAVIDRRAPQPGVYRHKNKARSYVDWTDRELHDQVIAWCELARAVTKLPVFFYFLFSHFCSHSGIPLGNTRLAD